MSFYQLTPEISQKLRQANLTASEWRLWAYLTEIDPWGDYYKDINPLAVIAECGVSKPTYYRAKAKFQELGLFDFQEERISFRNLTGVSKMKLESQKFNSQSQKFNSQSQKFNSQSQKRENQSPKPPTCKDSEAPQTIQTYSDFIQTLSEDERTRFINFCEAQTIHFNPPLVKLQTWLGSIDKVTGLPNYVELYEKFQRSPQEVQIRKQQQQQAQTQRWESDARLSAWLWEWSWFRNYGLTSEWIHLAATETEQQERREFASWAEIHGIGRPETQREEMPPSLIDAMTLTPEQQKQVETLTKRKQQLKSVISDQLAPSSLNCHA